MPPLSPVRGAAAAILALALATPAAAQAARDLAGYAFFYFNHDAGPRLMVMPQDGGSGEPDIPFMMACPADRDWTITISDADPATLGGAIAAGERVSFRLLRLLNGATSEIREFFPSLSFGEMYGTWDMTATWTPYDDLTAEIVRSDLLAVVGTGIAMQLPEDNFTGPVDAFALACDEIGRRLRAP